MINLLGKIISSKIVQREKDFFRCLEKYFDMNKKQCREALDIYKKFLDRTDKVSNFLKVAEVNFRLVSSFSFVRSIDLLALSSIIRSIIMGTGNMMIIEKEKNVLR